MPALRLTEGVSVGDRANYLQASWKRVSHKAGPLAELPESWDCLESLSVPGLSKTR